MRKKYCNLSLSDIGMGTVTKRDYSAPQNTKAVTLSQVNIKNDMPISILKHGIWRKI